MKFKYLTAPVYKNLFSSEILDMEPQETKATCHSCLMSKTVIPKAKRYREDLKCCTFYPFLPNYAVGAVLSDPKLAKGREVIENIIKENKYSLPIGLVPPVKYQMTFRKRKPGDFGNIETWLCPYFDKTGNQCSIWSYRGAVCTSFYCKSSFGQKGKKFWAGVSDYLTYVEMGLMEEALIRLDFSPRQIGDCLMYLNRDKAGKEELKTWSLPEKTARVHWRDYYENQTGFFIKCYELVKGFDKNEFKEMMGEQGKKLESQMLVRYGNLHESH
jgi:hypothetical protein